MISGVRFTQRLRTVLAASRDEAHRLRHEYIGTEHLLLGLLRADDGISAAVLQSLDVEPERIRQKLEETIVPGRRVTIGPDLPYTSRGKRVLELTIEEAERSSATGADVEHLFIALCVEDKGIAAQMLAWAGITTEVVRAQVAQIESRIPQLTPEKQFASLRALLVGRAISDRQLVGNSLSLWVDKMPGDGDRGWTIWLEPAWNVVGPERVLAGSMQAQDEEDESGWTAVAAAVDVLIGRTIERLHVDAVTGDLLVALTNGLVVRTFASDPRETLHWRIRDHASGVSVVGSPRGMRVDDSNAT